MRDHPWHKNKVLAGMLGSKLTNVTVKLQWENAFEIGFKSELFSEDRNTYGYDQKFLSRYHISSEISPLENKHHPKIELNFN